MSRTIDAVEVLLGRVRAAVLADLLAPGREPLFVREVARRTGFAVAAVQRELATLGRMGLIRSERRGRQVFHVADPSSPLYAPLSMLIGTRGDIASAVVAALHGFGPRVRLAVRYGKVDPDAPLSLLVVGDVQFEDALGVLSPIAARAGVEPRLLVFSEAGFRARSRDALVADALAERSGFLVGDEATLARMMASR